MRGRARARKLIVFAIRTGAVMRPCSKWLLVLIVFLFSLVPTVARADAVDLELVLAVDVSRSIDEEEWELQRQGYAEAFMHPAVIRAIQSNPLQRIAVAYVEWGGADYQRLVILWTVVSDAGSGERFARAILREPRTAVRWTSISGAIDFSMRVLALNPHRGTRRVIDISGDGINNNGRPAADARDEALAAGVTINGLVIMNDRPTLGFYDYGQPPLDQYYRDHVIGGTGAFVIAIEDFTSFAYAIQNKLIKEIAGTGDSREFAASGGEIGGE